VSREVAFPALLSGVEPDMSDDAMRMCRAYRAPVMNMPDAAYNGLRRFPLSIPVDSYDNGNGAAQTHHYRTLLNWNKPVNFIWGCADDVFTEAWGRQWAAQMNASFTAIPDAGHFLQNTHGALVAKYILSNATQR
jgi:haloalkane dehalogenase